MLQVSDLILGFNLIPNMYTNKHNIQSSSACCGHDATGPMGVVCTHHPLVPPDVPVCLILVPGWTGQADGSTLHPKTTALKACNIGGGGVVCQPPPILPNRLQDQQQGPK